MRMGKSVLLEIVRIVDVGISEGSDVSQALRDLVFSHTGKDREGTFVGNDDVNEVLETEKFLAEQKIGS